MKSSKPRPPTYQMNQCRLKKGTVEKTVWIPMKFAVKGKVLRIKDDDGWVVDEVFRATLTSKVVHDRSSDYKNTRKASDI